MNKKRIGARTHRVLQLLIGLRHPAAIAALSRHGFSPEDLQEGARRLSAVTTSQLSASTPTADLSVVAQIDAFENAWFPIVRATLEHHYPDVAELLFANLQQADGVRAALSVGEFLKRFRTMEAGEGGYGERGQAARALIAQRGLTVEVIEEAERAVAVLGSFVAPSEDTQAQARAELEASMWAWYLEWSKIARVAIKDRRVLRALGFRRTRAGSDELIDELEEDPLALPAPEAPTTSPGAITTPALPASTETNPVAAE